LHEVVHLARRIVVGRITAVEKASPMIYDVTVTRVWLGRLPDVALRFVYRYPEAHGSLLDASGQEHEPETDQTWMFLSSDEEGESVFRVEPEGSEDRILELLD